MTTIITCDPSEWSYLDKVYRRGGKNWIVFYDPKGDSEVMINLERLPVLRDALKNIADEGCPDGMSIERHYHCDCHIACAEVGEL